jgi:hypothetical protein
VPPWRDLVILSRGNSQREEQSHYAAENDASKELHFCSLPIQGGPPISRSSPELPSRAEPMTFVIAKTGAPLLGGSSSAERVRVPGPRQRALPASRRTCARGVSDECEADSLCFRKSDQGPAASADCFELPRAGQLTQDERACSFRDRFIDPWRHTEQGHLAHHSQSEHPAKGSLREDGLMTLDESNAPARAQTRRRA